MRLLRGPQDRRWVLVWCLGAFAVLVTTLGAQSIWWDEGISLHLASLSWSEIVADRAANIHPPLYFFLLKAWTAVVGNSPFTGRYLSALATTLLPALAYAFLRPRLGSRSATVTAFLLSSAPPFIVYGQEVRAYALLPLGVLLLWRFVWPVHSSIAGAAGHKGVGRRGLGLGLVQAGLLLMHYAGAIAVIVATVGYAVRWWRQRRVGAIEAARETAEEWVIGAVVTAASLIPWGVLVLSRGAGGLSRQAGLGNALAEPVPSGYLAALIGVFHTVGLPEAVGLPHLMAVARWIGITAVLAAILVLRCSERRLAFLSLVGLWLTPFLAVPAIWLLSPQSHPRYLYAFVAGGWLVVGTEAGLSGVPKYVRLGLTGMVLVSSLLGLTTYFTDPEVARSDIRATAEYIRSVARDGDVALVPNTDWSLAQYDIGRAALEMVPARIADDEGRTYLPLEGAAGRRAFVLDYERGSLDPRGAVRAALTWGGILVERREFQGVNLEVYEIAGEANVAECQPVARTCVAGTDLCLTGMSVAQSPVSGSAVPVAFCWSKGPADIPRYGVAVRLQGPAGDFIVADHDLLLDASLSPSELWPEEHVASYHLLPLPVGALPQPHSIEISLYESSQPNQSVVLEGPELSGPAAVATVGHVTPAVSPWRATSLYGLASVPDEPAIRVTPALRLVGARLDRESVRPGEAFYVSLRWELAETVPGTVRPELELVQDGKRIAVVASAIGTLSLPPGRPALETLVIAVPPDTESGEGEVVLQVVGTVLGLGEIELQGTEHLFEPPDLAYPVDGLAEPAALLGFDLAPGTDIVGGEPVTVTLVWRAAPEAASQDLKVFVHLVDQNGQLAAQDDAKPVNWTRPTTSWLPDEIVVDPHPLTWHQAAVEGPAHIVVGFYDEVTGRRQIWSNGADAFELPVKLSLTQP